MTEEEPRRKGIDWSKLSCKHLKEKRAAKKRRKGEIETYKKELIIDDHLIPLKEFYTRYDTDPDRGLTSTKAAELLVTIGPNELTPPRTTPQIVIFSRHMFLGFSLILWLASILCIVAYTISAQTQDEPEMSNLYLGVIILVVVIVTGLFGFLQDRTSLRIMDSFKKMITHTATVIRDGKVSNIPSQNLVKGDVVLIKFGSKVPADVRIIENFGMKVDNSSLTGETEPQPRGVEATSNNVMETQNVAFYSSSVMEGTCKAVVFETGDRTVIGRLATLTVGLKRADSPMTVEIQHFVKLITIVAVVISTAFIILALSMGYDIITCFVYFVALLVANIPEGLLVTVTLSLTLTAKKMAKKNCLIKSLDSVETLGSTSTICSDKTGTLTQNRMTVTEIMYNFKAYPVKYSSDRNSTVADEFDRNDPDFLNLMRCGRLCLRAEFEEDDDTSQPILNRNVEGDASEAGILKCVECIFPNVKEYRRANPKAMEIPFNSTNKYQLSIHRTRGGNILLMKGAPEKIIQLCSTVSFQGKPKGLGDDGKNQINAILNEMGGKGERVLGFCDAELTDPPNTEYDPNKKNFPTSGLRFLGLMALIDPPREAVPDAVAKCKTAGIRVIMVTGDHPVTAEAIAKKVGIISKGTRKDVAAAMGIPEDKVDSKDVKSIVVSGDQLRSMSADELDKIIKNHDEIVFARTTPTQKLSIVESCQRLGYITAVTGDGVNDSPALKKADIGIAMGIAGSDVSKQAADMVLLDDNFASIVVGVEQGRIIFDNLKKSICYVLTSNIPEMAPFIAYIIFQIPMPLSVIAILIVDIGTDMVPAIALAYEKAESDIMRRKPRNPFLDKLVNRRLIWMSYGQIGIIQVVAAFTAYFVVMAQYGFLPLTLLGIRERWENKALSVTDSYGQEWGYKPRKGMTNWVLNAGLLFAVALGCTLLYTPGLYEYLLMPPIQGIHWLPGVPYALLIIVFDEIRRLILRHRPGGWVEREFYY
ncbi:hypothetical protein RUM43_012879 [Polyplax serrata]|uniref:Sodium/potassium-transporting ATPase subunit alpha n=1 Tax=Polyplax serrata TaxID=468196 RepID=A0AAN8RZE2_POLSC